MIHLDDGVLRAYLDRELAQGEEGVGDHLAGCPDCRARVRELRRAEVAVRGALTLLDGPVPADAAWVRVSAAGTERARPTVRAARTWWTSPLARAAGLALLLGGGAAAAVLPGSPLRSLWAPTTPPPPEASAVEASGAPPVAGIRAAGASASVRVVVTAPGGTEVEVVATDGRPGVFGPPSSTFSTDGGVLRAEASGGPLRIEIPEDLPTTTVEINGRILVEIRDGRVVTTLDGPSRDDALPLRFRVP